MVQQNGLNKYALQSGQFPQKSRGIQTLNTCQYLKQKRCNLDQKKTNTCNVEVVNFQLEKTLSLF